MDEYNLPRKKYRECKGEDGRYCEAKGFVRGVLYNYYPSNKPLFLSARGRG